MLKSIYIKKNMCYNKFRVVGTWLSLVEYLLGVQGVASSNLVVPTTEILRLKKFRRSIFLLYFYWGQIQLLLQRN